MIHFCGFSIFLCNTYLFVHSFNLLFFLGVLVPGGGAGGAGAGAAGPAAGASKFFCLFLFVPSSGLLAWSIGSKFQSRHDITLIEYSLKNDDNFAIF